MILNKGYFRLARNTLFYSNCKPRVAAVISKKTPLAVGFNILRTHPRYSNPDTMDTTSIHAEMMVLTILGSRVRGCDIYIYREGANGLPALARPCEMCYNELKKYGIKKMYYSIGEPPYWKCEKI